MKKNKWLWVMIILLVLLVLSFLPLFGSNCSFEGGACVRFNFWEYIQRPITVL